MRHSPKSTATAIERRSGITIIEILVAIVVIGLLIAVSGPAIQHVREVARSSQCRNNLKQIGLAIHSYEAAHTMWPPGASRGLSWHVALLPFIEQQSLADLVDESLAYEHAADKIRHIPVSTFLCPTDSAPPVSDSSVVPTAATSYLGNSGTCVLVNGFDGVFRHLEPWRPDLYDDGPIRSKDITDGLSQTAAVAEVLHSVGFNNQSRLRIVWNTPNQYAESDFAQFQSDCRSIPPEPTQYGWVGTPLQHGLSWVHGDTGFSTYNHALPPQSPSCFNGQQVQLGIYSAASAHAGHLNVLHADGHVQNMSLEIDSMIWFNLGSRQ